MIGYIKSKMRNQNGFLIFFIFLIIHLLPLFSVDILLTLDGPSHLYNAKLFNELLTGNDLVSELYQINTELVPNYLGHLILSFFIVVDNTNTGLKNYAFSLCCWIGFSFS